MDNEEAAELARRLHDGPRQTFHAIRLQVVTLGNRTGPRDSALIDELSQEALKGVKDLQRVMLRLNPSLPFEDLDKGRD